MPVSLTVLRASINDILASVKQKLMTDLVLESHQVRIIARDDRERLPHTLATQHILLRPMKPVPLQEWVQGAGRIATVIERPLAVIARTRMQSDVGDMDELVLTNVTEGHFLFEDKVLDSLQMFFPIDSQGNHIVIEPMRILEGTDAPQSESDDIGWTETVMVFSLKYMASLNQAVQ